MRHRDIALLLWRITSPVRLMATLAIVAMSVAYITLMTMGLLDWRDVIRSGNEMARTAVYSGLALTGTLAAVALIGTALLWTPRVVRLGRAPRLLLPLACLVILGTPLLVGPFLTQTSDHRLVFGVAALVCASAGALLFIGAAAAYWSARKRLKRRIIGSWGQVCPGCAYDLGGRREDGRCPECGRPYSSATIHLSWRYWLEGP